MPVTQIRVTLGSESLGFLIILAPIGVNLPASLSSRSILRAIRALIPDRFRSSDVKSI